MLLDKLDFLGLLFFIGLNLIPVYTLFVTATVKVQDYMKGKRVTKTNGTAVSEPWAIDFMIISRTPYDFVRRVSTGRVYILPYELFMFLVVTGAVLNGLGMFWVWVAPSHYAYWSWLLVLSFQLCNILLVAIWKHAFFNVVNYRWAVISSFLLVVMAITSFIVLIAVNPKRWNVYVFNGLVSLYYGYILAVSATFRRANCMNRLYRIESGYSEVPLINAVLGEPTKEEQLSCMSDHGFRVANGNHEQKHI